MKPYKGEITGWSKRSWVVMSPDWPEEQGYYIQGRCIEHPEFGTSNPRAFFTSNVLSHNEETGEIETLILACRPGD